MSTHRRSPSAWRALWAAHNTPAEGSWLRQKATSLAILGLYLLAESAMASAPPDIYFQCIYLDNALTFLGNPALAPANPAENPAWCCGLDQSDGDSQRTVVCTGNATDGSLAISELRWTNAGLKGSLTSLRPSWLSHLKLLNFSGNTGLVGSFPSWLQDTDQWKTLVSLNLDDTSLSGPIPDLSYHSIEYLYLRGTRLRSQVVMPWFMRQCFLDSDVSRTCFPATAYIPPACEASGSKRCPTNTTLPTATPAWIRWTCIEGFNTPVRLALDGQDQVPACMTTDGKACIFTQTFEECQVLANTPRPNTVALTCGQKFAEIYGASGYSYNPLTWCTAAYFALDSTAIIAHWPFPPNPTLNYTCLPRIHTPVTIIPETGETACMLAPRTQGNPVGCLWFNSRKACLAAVKTPPADVDVTNPFSCGNWHKKVYGVDGYNDTDPRNWCSAGRKALRPNETNYEGEMTLFPTPTKTILTSVSIPTETLTGGMPGPGGVSYFCIPTVHTPLRISPNGKDVACMSLDGYLCYWLQTTDECQIAAGKGDASTSNLSCGADYDKVYGTTDGGYYEGSWCTLGRAALLGN